MGVSIKACSRPSHGQTLPYPSLGSLCYFFPPSAFPLKLLPYSSTDRAFPLSSFFPFFPLISLSFFSSKAECTFLVSARLIFPNCLEIKLIVDTKRELHSFLFSPRFSLLPAIIAIHGERFLSWPADRGYVADKLLG